MRRVWLPGAIAWMALCQPVEPRLDGTWSGVLEAGPIKLRLALHLSRSADGRLAGTLDSIDQGAVGIPTGEVELKGQSVVLQFPKIGSTYEGALSQDGAEMSGQWKQAGVVLPLTFKRGERIPEFVRPQDPVPPYPYNEEEVVYENKAAGIKLVGTLTLPRSKGPHPAVLLITGSGPQDRNEAIAGHRPFLVLADYLTRRGIAVLRVDDRGVGKSTGNFRESTAEDFAGDALAGVEFLRARPDINRRQIGLIGHSEGGLIAPMVASQSSDVAFLVMMAGPGVTGEKILLAQGYLIPKAVGMPEDVASKNREMQELIFKVLQQEKDNAVAAQKIRQGIARMRTGLPKDQQKALDELAAQAEAQIPLATSRWFRAFLSYDPRPILMRVKAAVLAVNGELDLQVPARQNLPAIAQALEAGGNPDYTIVKLPRLNHLFQTSQTGSPLEYARIDETIAPAALEVIGDWIARHIRK